MEQDEDEVHKNAKKQTQKKKNKSRSIYSHILSINFSKTNI